jgi:hypothetical protein
MATPLPVIDTCPCCEGAHAPPCAPDACPRCGDAIGEDRTLCEACRYAVPDEVES